MAVETPLLILLQPEPRHRPRTSQQTGPARSAGFRHAGAVHGAVMPLRPTLPTPVDAHVDAMPHPGEIREPERTRSAIAPVRHARQSDLESRLQVLDCLYKVL